MIPDLHSSYVAEGPTLVNGIVCRYDQVYEEMELSPVEIRISTHWILIAYSMTAPPPMLSPSSILPSSSSHCAFVPTRKNSGERLTTFNFRKIASHISPSVRPLVCLSVRPSAWNNSVPNGRILNETSG